VLSVKKACNLKHKEREGSIMSDDFNLEDTLKNIFFAGVGAVSLSAEKSKKVIDKLVEKGEITVEQGKAMNKELKHKAEEAAGEAKKES
jgi:polyhydroxyalkanoate synthesis regulator phasin